MLTSALRAHRSSPSRYCNDDGITISISDEHSIHSIHKEHKEDRENKLIQCGACFRSFHTQAQFGQHSRICREGKVVIRHLIQSEDYKYAFLEKQNKQKLEVKSRFVIDVADSENWKKISRKTGLYDGGIKKMLHSKDINNVDVAIRQRRASGLIIANFMVRNVTQNAKAIHAAKSSIEAAVDAVYHQLPNSIAMRLHLCKTQNCQELVIRDTEGFCSRHRAQKYHKKSYNHKVYQKEENQDETVHKQEPKPKPKQKQKQEQMKDETYNKLFNHLCATAPPSKITKTSLVQADNVNNITIEDDGVSGTEEIMSTTEDDELVAQILINLRATCTQKHNKNKNNDKTGRKRTLKDVMDPTPTKKAKLMNNNQKHNDTAQTPIYMVPVPVAMHPSILNMYQPMAIPMYQPIPISMQSVPYAFVPVVPSHNNDLKLLIDTMNTINSMNTTNITNINNFAGLHIPKLPPIASFRNVNGGDNDDNESQSTDN